MMRQKTIITLLACAWLAPAYAQQPRDPETWEREHALRASVTPQNKVLADALMQGARTGDDRATLAQIQSVGSDPALPAPARERLLYEFVTELRREAPRAIGNEAMGYLKQYSSTVLVQDIDHPRMQVPLFNIRSAAAGLDNLWTRQESAARGARLLQTDARALVEAFAATNSVPVQQGLLDSLAGSAPAMRQSVAEAALAQMESKPGMAELVGEAALLNEDGDLLERLLRSGPTPGIHRLLREGATAFDTDRNARLLSAALDSGSGEVAALAIAELAPAVAGHGPSLDRLFTELGQPETGSAAALALAGNPDPAVLTRLEAIVRDQAGSLAASRAQLALQMIEARLVRDVQ